MVFTCTLEGASPRLDLYGQLVATQPGKKVLRELKERRDGNDKEREKDTRSPERERVRLLEYGIHRSSQRFVSL